MTNVQLHGDAFSVTATHATSAVATKAAAADTTHYVTTASASSDKAGAILLVKQGTTVLWQMQIGASFVTVNFNPPLPSAVNALVSVTIDGTAACKANLAGYSLKTA